MTAAFRKVRRKSAFCIPRTDCACGAHLEKGNFDRLVNSRAKTKKQCVSIVNGLAISLVFIITAAVKLFPPNTVERERRPMD